ncbi:MAG: ABC transporter permease [Halobacteriaceae archaeon]
MIEELLITLAEFAIGFGTSAVTGYLLATLMFIWDDIERILYPYIIVYRTIPVIALLPICIIWFGFGLVSITVVSFLISFFPMVVNTLAGYKSTDDELIGMMKSFSASRKDLYLNLFRYSSLPMVFSGLKIAVVLAFTGAIVGEFLIGQRGIGYMALYYNNNFETEKMFAAIFTATIAQLSIFGAVAALERYYVDWT